MAAQTVQRKQHLFRLRVHFEHPVDVLPGLVILLAVEQQHAPEVEGLLPRCLPLLLQLGVQVRYSLAVWQNKQENLM